MKVPMSWFSDYVNIDKTPHEFASALTMSGSMVEGVEEQGKNINKVVTGKIVKIEKHPDADKLVVCQLDVGNETIQIVTGAKNVFEGAVVPVALDGSTLPGGKIKKGKLRGVESFGMLCSDDELGISSERAEGIMILDDSTPIGKDIKEILGINDVIYDFEITSNRPDCLSVIGLAREVAVTFNKPFSIKTPVVKESGGDINNYIKINIQDKDLCSRYSARVVKNVKIEPSPLWLKKRLENSGVRSINNIVDITNYVMLEYGQPMHAFDLRTIGGNVINVRRAANGEKITTLDEIDRTLDSDMLVIADSTHPVAVAGVMGGENTEIKDDTTSILFESATFNGGSVRRTAKRLGLRTEASARFEKGLDPNNTIDAVNRACELIEMLGAGEVVSGIVDVCGELPSERQIKLSPESINKFLGTDISEQFMKDTLISLGFKVENGIITVPTFRADVEGEADIAEEVARIYGYNNIPSTLLKGEATIGGKNDEQIADEIVKDTLTALGFYEIVTQSFTGPKMYEKLMIPKDNAIVISNPLGEDQSIMRTNTIDSMLNVISTNYNYRNNEAYFFEIGTKYLPGGENGIAVEKKEITIGMYGKDTDYYKLKGVVEQILLAFNITHFDIEAEANNTIFHPGQTAVIKIKGKNLALLGKIHPLVQRNYEIGTDVYVTTIDFETLFSAKGKSKTYKHLPKFPSVTRDIAIIVKDDVTVRDIENIFKKIKTNILESYSLFDVYKGKQVDEGYKSIAYSLVFRAANKTLTDDEVNPVLDTIVSQLEGTLNAKLRIS